MLGIDGIIMFGIKAGVKLAQQGRQSFVEATGNRELVLPLPDFHPDVLLSAAFAYFRGGGRVHLAENPRAKGFFEKSESGTVLTPKEEEELLLTYQESQLLDQANSGQLNSAGAGFSNEALLSLVSIRQWARNNTPHPAAAQRILGTLVEVGVDFYAANPGVMDEKSAAGRALQGFLKSLDDLNFAEENVGDLTRTLFLSAIESIDETDGLLGGDDKTSKLVEVVARGLIRDVSKRLGELNGGDLSKQEKIQDWAQLVLRSVLSHGGDTVLANPRLFLGLDDPGKQALVSSVGTSILAAIVDDEKVDLARLLSRRTLDTVVKSALAAVAENPDLARGPHPGVQLILVQLAKDLAETESVLGVDLFPEVFRLVLERTAQNAEVLWPDEFNDSGKHFLVTASKILLQHLATPRSGVGWRPGLTHSQLVDIIETTLDEVVQNPQWLITSAAASRPVLAEVLESVLTRLKKIPGKRLSQETGVAIIKAAILGVARRKELLGKLTVGGEETNGLAAVLDTIIDKIFGDDVDGSAQWTLAHGGVLTVIVSAVFSKVAETGVSEPVLTHIEGILQGAVGALSSNKNWRLEELLRQIAEMTA